MILHTPTDIFPDANIPVTSCAWQYTGLYFEGAAVIAVLVLLLPALAGMRGARTGTKRAFLNDG